MAQYYVSTRKGKKMVKGTFYVIVFSHYKTHRVMYRKFNSLKSARNADVALKKGGWRTQGFLKNPKKGEVKAALNKAMRKLHSTKSWRSKKITKGIGIFDSRVDKIIGRARATGAYPKRYDYSVYGNPN